MKNVASQKQRPTGLIMIEDQSKMLPSWSKIEASPLFSVFIFWWRQREDQRHRPVVCRQVRRPQQGHRCRQGPGRQQAIQMSKNCPKKLKCPKESGDN